MKLTERPKASLIVFYKPIEEVLVKSSFEIVVKQWSFHTGISSILSYGIISSIGHPIGGYKVGFTYSWSSKYAVQVGLLCNAWKYSPVRMYVDEEIPSHIRKEKIEEVAGVKLDYFLEGLKKTKDWGSLFPVNNILR